MNEQFNRPKGFGEILDTTFRLAKNNFKELFLVIFILIGPIYLVQALIDLGSGTNFFREVGSSGNWFDQVTTSFVEEPATSTTLGQDFGLILLSIISTLLLPVAQVAILYAVNHIRKVEEFTVGNVIKQAFARFWPIVGSSVLLMLIAFALIVLPIIMITIASVTGSFLHPSIGSLLGIPLFLGLALGVGLLFTRWSFFLGLIAFGEGAPSLGRSWKLTQNRTWVLFGIFVVFSIIIGIISAAVEVPVMFVLGNSVLYTIILNVVSLFTTMIFTIGYAVMFFDLKIRNEADDLKDMIDAYNEPK